MKPTVQLETAIPSLLRRVAKALHARMRVVLEPDSAGKTGALAEETTAIARANRESLEKVLTSK